LKNKTFIIIKLISKYLVENEIIDEEELIGDLLDQGFDIKEIEVALNWLESLGLDIRGSQISWNRGWRILSSEERDYLTPEARNYLFKLKEKGIIDSEAFENILERIMIAGPERKLDIDEIKLLLSLISFNSADTPDRNFLKLISDDGEIIYN